MKPMLRDRTDRAWFSRLVQHLARKRSGSILTTPETARGNELLSLTIFFRNVNFLFILTIQAFTHTYIKIAITSLLICFRRLHDNVCNSCVITALVTQRMFLIDDLELFL